jgi:hypothetical protein
MCIIPVFPLGRTVINRRAITLGDMCCKSAVITEYKEVVKCGAQRKCAVKRFLRENALSSAKPLYCSILFRPKNPWIHMAVKHNFFSLSQGRLVSLPLLLRC